MVAEMTTLAVQKAQALSLAVFRICYGIVLLIEVCHFYYFRHLVLDPIPYLQPAPSLLGLLLVVWLVTTICIIFGIWTKSACVLNYVFSVMFLGGFAYPWFEYHVDYVYIGVNFLLILTPLSDRLSVDSYWQRKKEDRSLSVRNYAIFKNTLLFVGVALVYGDSVFFKFASPMWLSGSGVWLPASLPQNSWFPVPQIMLDQKWLMLFLGYLTLAFETTFPFLMWWRRARWFLFFVGVGLHLSIGLVFPIPLFGLVYMALYLLLLPISFWQSLDSRIQGFRKDTKLAPVSQTEISLPGWFQSGLREKLTIATLCFATLLQISLIIGRYPGLPKYVKPNALKPIVSLVTDSCASFRSRFITHSHVFLGIIDHAVFIDNHFRKYNRLYSIGFTNSNGQQVLLPLTRSDGTNGTHSTGRVWAFWCFRVNGVGVTPKAFELGIRRLTSFWAYKNHISLDHAEFEILSRPVETPENWRPGHLTEQKKQEWKVVGHALWRDRNFTLAMNTKTNDLNKDDSVNNILNSREHSEGLNE